MIDMGVNETAIVEALQEDHPGNPYIVCGELFFDVCGPVAVSRMAAILRKHAREASTEDWN